jgi:hypothetical protein
MTRAIWYLSGYAYFFVASIGIFDPARSAPIRLGGAGEGSKGGGLGLRKDLDISIGSEPQTRDPFIGERVSDLDVMIHNDGPLDLIRHGQKAEARQNRLTDRGEFGFVYADP